MSKLIWERLNDSIPVFDGKELKTYRAKVPGGWLVASGSLTNGVTFYPDFDHEWDGGSLR